MNSVSFKGGAPKAATPAAKATQKTASNFLSSLIGQSKPATPKAASNTAKAGDAFVKQASKKH